MVPMMVSSWKRFYKEKRGHYRTQFPFLKDDQIAAKLKRLWGREQRFSVGEWGEGAILKPTMLASNRTEAGEAVGDCHAKGVSAVSHDVCVIQSSDPFHCELGGTHSS